MPRHRTASALGTTLALLLLGSTASTAAPGQWEGPQVIDAEHPGIPVGLAANAEGVFAVWTGGPLRIAHRDPGSGEVWSAPQPLENSSNKFLESGPVMALPAGGAVVFATVAAAERTYTWRVSADGVPAPRRQFPFELFTPTTATHTAGGRWLVAGSSQGVPGPMHAAVRSAAGSWRVSDQLPVPRSDLLGAWFDRDGVPHVMAVSAVPDSLMSSGGRPIVEATLRGDGSWTRVHQVAETTGGDTTDRPSVVANADGDVTLAYYAQPSPSRTVTRVITRPFGGAWSDPVQFTQESPAMTIDERGRTFVVRAGNEVFAGRMSPLGVLDGWQQLTDDSFQNDYIGRMDLTGSPGGVVVVGVVGELTTPDGTSHIERYVRCLPGEACAEVGDFAGGDSSNRSLVSGPAGAVWAVSDNTPACQDGAALCSWRLPAPAPAAQP